MISALGRWLVFVGPLLAVTMPGLSAPPSAVTGTVRDEAGRPVAGAVVRFQTCPASVRSGTDGSFHLAGSSLHRVTAWKDGFLIAGASAGRSPLALTLRRLPAADNERYQWVGPDAASPSNCGNCHGDIYREWSMGGHAHSATNRRFLNLYAGSDWHGRPNRGWNLLHDRPDSAGVCAACHAPTAEIAAVDFDLRRIKGVDAQGVHCDFCHKIAGPGGGDVGLTHGRYFYQLLRPERGQLFFGPLDDVDRGEDAFSPFQRESRYCAGCHEGTVLGVHVYGTYSEWRDGPAARAGKQCQDCHMKPSGLMRNMAAGHGGLVRDPKTLASHRLFPGGQAAMLRHCLSLTVTARGPKVRVTVRADDVGHRVPTGFVDRNLMLIVEGIDAAGRPVAALKGPKLPVAVGRELAGQPGRLFAKLLRDFDGHSPAPFWNADPEPAADTRLRPGEADVSEYAFPANVRQVKARLVYRRFWREVANAKGWPDEEIVVTERTVDLNR